LLDTSFEKGNNFAYLENSPSDKGDSEYDVIGYFDISENDTKSLSNTIDECEYQATEQGSLNRHRQTNHEVVKYLCNQCEYQASAHYILNRHRKSNQEGLKYSCDHCSIRQQRRNILGGTNKSNIIRQVT
jgi:hypothetical protein